MLPDDDDDDADDTDITPSDPESLDSGSQGGNAIRGIMMSHHCVRDSLRCTCMRHRTLFS